MSTGVGESQVERESPETADGRVPGDLAMTRALWPLLLASAVGLLPFTVFSTYLVPIAHDAGSSVAAMGGLRGLGGLAALLVGTALAPLIDRIPKAWAAAGGLGTLAAAAALGASGETLLLGTFCLLTGAGTAVLNPALTAAAADRFGSGKAAGRAATLVTATQSMTAMLAAPLVALPAVLWGWQGDLLAVAAAAALLAVLLLSRKGRGDARSAAERAGDGEGLTYLASFRALAGVRGVVPLLLISLLRTAVFMGYLAYLAAYYDSRFQLGPGLFSFVWTLSGASFFVSNLLTGRLTNSVRPRVRTEHLLLLGLATALVTVVGFYFTHWLPLALVLTALHAAGHAVVAACAVSLLVRRCGMMRGSALSLNAAGMSLGVFVGASLGGAGLGLAGYPGVALVFGALVVVALGAAVPVARSRPPGGGTPDGTHDGTHGGGVGGPHGGAFGGPHGGAVGGAPGARAGRRPAIRKWLPAACAALLVLLAVSVVVAIGLGPAVVTPGETARYLWAALTGGEIGAGEATAYQIVWEIRTPRVLLAALVGAGLSTIGVAIQALVRNALADPYVLGVSSGASVGAVSVTVTGGLAGLGVYAVSGGAFLGALAASALVYAASAGPGGLSPLRLILTGVAMALGFQAVMSVIVYLIPGGEATSTVLYWTMGSFGAATWAALPPVALAVLLGLAVLNRRSRALDVLALGDETAASLGVDPDRNRKQLLVLVSLVTGAMVAVSGAISFVGLVMPHVVRMLVGSTHARVLAVAPLAGAVFMVWVDLVARTLVAPRELPLGVITALAGVPVFVTLMRRRTYMFGGR